MIADQGGTILAINLDSRPCQVIFVAPDGKHQLCDILSFWQDGTPPTKRESPVLADSFTFEALGFNAQGEPCEVRYDARLEGLGKAIQRNADGSFGSRAADRMNERLKQQAARLPAIFDKEGRASGEV